MEIKRTENGITASNELFNGGEVTYGKLISNYYRRKTVSPETQELVVSQISIVSDTITYDDNMLKDFAASYFEIKESEITIR